MLGKTYIQQGRAATCKDSWYKANTKAVRGFRPGAGANSSEKGEVMLADTGMNPVLRGGHTYPQVKGLSVHPLCPQDDTIMGHSAQFTVETEPWDSRTVNLIG